jgi:hypothetical protein
VVGVDAEGVLGAGVEPAGWDARPSLAHAVCAAVFVTHAARGQRWWGAH